MFFYLTAPCMGSSTFEVGSPAKGWTAGGSDVSPFMPPARRASASTSDERPEPLKSLASRSRLSKSSERGSAPSTANPIYDDKYFEGTRRASKMYFETRRSSFLQSHTDIHWAMPGTSRRGIKVSLCNRRHPFVYSFAARDCPLVPVSVLAQRASCLHETGFSLSYGFRFRTP